MNILVNAFSGPITGRRFFIWMVSFFGVIAAVNAIFIFMALKTWPGLTTSKAYEEGLSYNKVLEQASAQDALGWHSHVRIGGTTPKGRVLSVKIGGPYGPLDGLTVTAKLSRPIGEGATITTTLTSNGNGQYLSLVRLPALGRWRVTLSAERETESSYRMTHDLNVVGGVE